MLSSYRNQSNNLLSKSIDWFPLKETLVFNCKEVYTLIFLEIICDGLWVLMCVYKSHFTLGELFKRAERMFRFCHVSLISTGNLDSKLGKKELHNSYVYTRLSGMYLLSFWRLWMSSISIIIISTKTNFSHKISIFLLHFFIKATSS